MPRVFEVGQKKGLSGLGKGMQSKFSKEPQVAHITAEFSAISILLQGLRVACLVGSAGTCLGAWIKLGSVSPDRFYVAFIGHSIVACSQVFVLSVPARLAAVWFGPDQVSSACSIGVFGNQVRTYLRPCLSPVGVVGKTRGSFIKKKMKYSTSLLRRDDH